MSLTYQDAIDIYQHIRKSSLQPLVHSLCKSAVRYAHLRAQWEFFSLEERAETDPERTAAHNRFIDACNILSRNQNAKGEDASWRQKLGSDRKDIGDFACYLHAIIGIKNR